MINEFFKAIISAILILAFCFIMLAMEPVKADGFLSAEMNYNLDDKSDWTQYNGRYDGIPKYVQAVGTGLLKAGIVSNTNPMVKMFLYHESMYATSRDRGQNGVGLSIEYRIK